MTFQKASVEAQSIQYVNLTPEKIGPVYAYRRRGDCETGPEQLVAASVDLYIQDGDVYADVVFQAYELDSDRSYGDDQLRVLVAAAPDGYDIVRIDGHDAWRVAPVNHEQIDQLTSFTPSPRSSPWTWGMMGRTYGRDYYDCGNGERAQLWLFPNGNLRVGIIPE